MKKNTMTKLYHVIYADPPYKYSNGKITTINGATRFEYPTMPLVDICNLDVPIAKNAVLYIWSPLTMVRDAITIMETWGFRYKSQIVWDKLTIGTGYWFRNQHEPLLVGVKGKFAPPHYLDRVSSVYQEKRNGHSVKPSYFRDMLSNAFPDLNKLELFARKKNRGLGLLGE